MEILSTPPSSPLHTIPVLFVHGGWCGAWCWAERFLPYFASQGFAAHALSLRGHGGGEPARRPTWASVLDYVEDVEQAVEQLACDPVLVGHSMGGFVVQHYLRRHRAPAAVLMASVPHRGLSWRIMLKITRCGMPLSGRAPGAAAVHSLAALLFTHSPPDDVLLRYLGLLNAESWRACAEMLGARLPRPGWVDTPMLVLAAGSDRILSPAEMYGLAHAYKADLDVVPEIGHVMMLDEGWERAAKAIIAWLRKRSAWAS